MFDLQAGVHFDEEEFAIFIQELDGPDAEVSDLLDGIDNDLADLFPAYFIQRR